MITPGYERWYDITWWCQEKDEELLERERCILGGPVFLNIHTCTCKSTEKLHMNLAILL